MLNKIRYAVPFQFAVGDLSGEGNPSLTSRTVINRGFQEGRWFEILEELSIEEKENIEKEIR